MATECFSFTNLNWPSFSSHSRSISYNNNNNNNHIHHQSTDLEPEFDVDDETATTQRHLRFQGVGRLYETKDNVNQTIFDERNPLAPHLQIVDRLTRATVAVVGLGGVGSWATEALCRSGIGNLVLIDLDDICISNTNRQLHAMSTTVGQMKVDAMRRRLLDINPDCQITVIRDFVSTENVHTLLDSLMPNLTVCLDAIDGQTSKTALMAACVERAIPLVTCGGSAGKTDPTQIVCDDLTRANGDHLLTSCRKNLRKLYGFSQGQKMTQSKGRKPKKWGIEAVYSLEETRELPEGGDTGVSALRRCDGALGTACFVTGTCGFVAASKVIDMIATNQLIVPKKGRIGYFPDEQ
jgi:tRNA threonylcarbamoyladenosine dehydratase